jgi:hypothetical protein
MKYRMDLRGYNSETVKHIVQYTSERYIDTTTGRLVAIGKHDKLLVTIPYEQEGNTITPVTIHATNRQQINSRLKSGKLEYE